MKQFYRTNKGSLGLTDFFSILAFALILIIFYLILNFTIGKIVFALPSASKNIEDSISLISILKTPVKIDDMSINVADIIALSNQDSSKRLMTENTIKQIIEKSYGTSICAIFCINEGQIKSKGCETLVGTQACSNDFAFVPSYEGQSIKVSFTSNIEPLNLQSAP